MYCHIFSSCSLGATHLPSKAPSHHRYKGKDSNVVGAVTLGLSPKLKSNERTFLARKRRHTTTAMQKSGVYALGSLIPKIANNCWIAPNAAVIGNVILEEHVSIWFGVTIRGDNPEPIHIQERTNIQDGVVLHADAGVPLTIGKGVTVGHQAMLHGCTIGDNSLIGIGATILNKSVIGKNCIIGAHALIPENKVIPDNSLVVGSPGKIIKELTEEQIEGLKSSANHYVENSQRFKNEIRPIDDDLDDGSSSPMSKL